MRINAPLATEKPGEQQTQASKLDAAIAAKLKEFGLG